MNDNLTAESKQGPESQGGRGHWAVYYTSPHRFITTFSDLLT